MKLSERDDELQLLERLYAGCVRGRGAVVLTNGPVGCGKTALLRAFAGRAVEQGALFFSVTASASEQFHQLGLVDQLVTAMRAAGMAADPFAAEEVGVTVSGDDPEQAGRAPLGLLQRICRTVCQFAEDRPLVVSIDDVHFADEPSLQCLRYLIRRIDSSSIMIVMNESSCHDRELATLHAETLHLPYCHRIRLAPLMVSGTAEQLTELLGAEPAREAAEVWAEVSGGNPLLLHALIEDHASAEAAPGEPAPGESFRHAFLRCLHRGVPAMLVVARVLAVLGESATPSLLGDFLGDDARSVRWTIADLNAAGLLSNVRFRHERAQLAVLADIPAKDLSAMHSRAAELLHRGGASAKAVAKQLIAAHDSDTAPWRVDILREAAREAMASGDAAESVTYLRHASRMCADMVQEAQITAALADAQWHIDPAKATRHLHQLSHMVRTGLLTSEDAMVPVKQLLWQGEFARADALLRRIEANAGEIECGSLAGAAPSDIMIARLWLSFCRPGLPGDAAAGADGVPSAWSGPMSALTFLTLSESLTWDDEDVQGADQVLHRTRAGSPLASTLFALIVLIQTGRLDEALLWSRRLLEEGWIRGVPVRRALFETIRAVAALRRGDVAEAGESARTALELVAPPSWGVVVGLPLSVAIRAATELGDFETVMTYLNLPVPPVMFDTPFVLPYLQASGHYHLAMGRPHTALTNFQSCGDLMVKWQLDSPDLADWRNDAAAALIAMGKARQARVLVEDQLSRLGGGRSRIRGIALRRLAAADDGPERLAWLQEAVRSLAESGDRLELARARADLEAAQEAVGRQGPSEPLVEFRAEEQDEPELADMSEADPLLAELTDAERRVAALAASGRTNREIASKLFITVSTVEQHLTKIYRKLRVRNRSDLPARLSFPNG
ncbi:AAA family ATPase [Streptomyces sp. NPDC048723]|uniref:helix-turn-helix transcriptional regulator n=1 Tax=Streptomyces sp. NPDC048723 TaxID=3365589 RepID=UPI00371DA063